MTTCEIEHYLTPGEQKDLYIDWLKRLRATQAKVAVARHETRIEQGNFGDHSDFQRLRSIYLPSGR